MPKLWADVVMRPCAVFAVAICFLMPGVVAAVGFGKPIVDSAIGEPLRVVVPLISIQPGELEELNVGIADASWYQISGLDYSDIAERLNVELDVAGSNPTIVVSTRQGINQVAVPLVLELAWPQRVMRKQFTVLLNPAGYQNELLAQGQTGGFAQSAPSNIATSTTQEVEEATQNTLSEDLDARESTQRPSKVSVQKGDSLSTIVDNFLPSGANRFQGRMAFYNDNPSAFQNGNIHLLTSGALLTVPSAEAILAIPASQARADYQALARVNIPTSAENESITSDESQSESSLTSVDEDTADSSSDPKLVETEEQTELDLSAVSEVESEAGNVGVGESEAVASTAGPQFEMQGFTMKLTVLNAYIVELQDENRQLQDRIAALEEKMEALIQRGSVVQEEPLASATEPTAAIDEVQQAIEADRKDDSAESILIPQQVTQQSFTEGGQETASVEGSSITEIQESERISNIDQSLVGGSDQIQPASLPDADQSIDTNLAAAAETNRLADAQTESELTAAANSSALTNTQGTVIGAEEAEVPPRVVYRRNLIEQASNFVNQFNTPIVKLVLGVLLAGLLLLAWLLRKMKIRNDEIEAEHEVEVMIDAGENVQIAYDTNNKHTMLDLDDEDGWVAQPEINPDNLNTLQESDVDLITQSEVYLTYNRPMQAAQALLEEYSKPDCDKFVVASRLIKIYQQMGEDEERNASLRGFIVTLNNDIEQFSGSEWDTLRNDLDSLRKTEQQMAVQKTDNSISPVEVEQTLSEQDISESTAPPTAEVNDLGNGIVELEFHPNDKAKSS